MNRVNDVVRFYEILAVLESRCGGSRVLRECTGRMQWPTRGVYFFFEPGEVRSDAGSGFRVVRVGTHAVSKGSKATLWKRLSQHRGTGDGNGGNHRGSIFRLLIGSALATRATENAWSTWGKGQSGAREVRLAEAPLEASVSRYLGQMPFLWLACDDEPSPESRRADVEKNSIALLSNARSGEPRIDPPSESWLGHSCPNATIGRSGLWNSRFVTETYDPGFLDRLEHLARQ